jgi:hypothetical protein
MGNDEPHVTCSTRQDQTPRAGNEGLACGIHRPASFFFGSWENDAPVTPTIVNEFGAQADNRNMGL